MLRPCTFLVEDEKLLNKNNEMWGEIKELMDKKFDNDLVFAKKYLKFKIKSYNNKTFINVNGKVLKEGINCVCLSAVVIFKSDKIIIHRQS